MPVRRVANIYLVLFLVDGAISVLDELMAGLTGMHLLKQIRNFVALPVLLLSLPMVIAMGMDRRLPKRLFMPMGLYALWAPLMFWPLPLFIPAGVFGLAVSSGQLAIGARTALILRKQSDEPIGLSPAMFEGPWFSWKHTLSFFGISAVAMPVLLVFLVLSSAGPLIEAKSGGFMKVRSSGLYMNEKIYSKDGKTLRLVPMIHIGSQGFYDAVGRSMKNGKTVILAEGVSDRGGLLKSPLDYNTMGNLLGLSSQAEMEMKATPIKTDFSAKGPSLEGDENLPHIVSADVDLADFSPLTVEFLGVLSTSFFGGKPFGKGYDDYKAWSKGKEEQALAAITHDIFTLRNNALLAMMNKALPRYDTLIIPWGALHMAAIEKEVVKLGFFKLGEKERLSINFSDAATHLMSVKRNP